MKRKLLCLLLVVAMMILTCCGGKHGIDQRDYSMTPLCIMSDFAGLSMVRDTEIQFFRVPYTGPDARVCETFTVHNSGKTNRLSLVYSSLLYAFDEKLPMVMVDGKVCTDWWGAASIDEIAQARENGTLVQNLNNGVWFRRAFENWPELGEQSHKIDVPGLDSNSEAIETIYYLSYYVQEVTIPAGESVEVTVKYDLTNASTIDFFRLEDEIPCTNHTVHISIEPDGKPNAVQITDQNLTDKLPEGDSWTVELAPEKTDYFITVQ